MEALKHPPASLQPFEVSDVIVWAQSGPYYTWLLAILVACSVSAVVVWSRRESWLIPLLVFVGTIVSSWTHYYESTAVYKALALLRWPFERLPMEARLALVGGALIAVGIALLLWPLRWRTGAKTAVTVQVAA
ncbi:hypothetical protein [Hymenobacter volaticus]|uniref:Uncharacterized protein n=1 Tax=Hymenobacter volaticus TaxID=2932254 RepID=A0ABY4G4W8_9BACT|nr:hypothetical protein [Hymenobacter volaticus]UOQ65853.1 hypothetical protein MUN86_20375 [Hymenobacter volaticus]